MLSTLALSLSCCVRSPSRVWFTCPRRSLLALLSFVRLSGQRSFDADCINLSLLRRPSLVQFQTADEADASLKDHIKKSVKKGQEERSTLSRDDRSLSLFRRRSPVDFFAPAQRSSLSSRAPSSLSRSRCRKSENIWRNFLGAQEEEEEKKKQQKNFGLEFFSVSGVAISISINIGIGSVSYLALPIVSNRKYK